MARRKRYSLDPEKEREKTLRFFFRKNKAAERVRYVAHSEKKKAAERVRYVAHSEKKKAAERMRYVAHFEKKKAAERVRYVAHSAQKSWQTTSITVPICFKGGLQCGNGISTLAHAL